MTAPFTFRANLTLVIAPGVNIAEQLAADVVPGNPPMFYQKCDVLTVWPYPKPVEMRGTTVNRGDFFDETHIVITNIQQLQRTAEPMTVAYRARRLRADNILSRGSGAGTSLRMTQRV